MLTSLPHRTERDITTMASWEFTSLRKLASLQNQEATVKNSVQRGLQNPKANRNEEQARRDQIALMPQNHKCKLTWRQNAQVDMGLKQTAINKQVAGAERVCDHTLESKLPFK